LISNRIGTLPDSIKFDSFTALLLRCGIRNRLEWIPLILFYGLPINSERIGHRLVTDRKGGDIERSLTSPRENKYIYIFLKRLTEAANMKYLIRVNLFFPVKINVNGNTSGKEYPSPSNQKQLLNSCWKFHPMSKRIHKFPM
jgi:hypothetical protein